MIIFVYYNVDKKKNKTDAEKHKQKQCMQLQISLLIFRQPGQVGRPETIVKCAVNRRVRNINSVSEGSNYRPNNHRIARFSCDSMASCSHDRSYNVSLFLHRVVYLSFFCCHHYVANKVILIVTQCENSPHIENIITASPMMLWSWSDQLGSGRVMFNSVMDRVKS